MRYKNEKDKLEIFLPLVERVGLRIKWCVMFVYDRSAETNEDLMEQSEGCRGKV